MINKILCENESFLISENGDYIIEENPFKMECFILFKGEIGQWSMTEDEISFNIVSKLAHWNQRTLYRHPANCRWRVFAQFPCNYSGSEISCDRSYTRCLELSNTANFGGFRFLPYLENKDILWGPK